MVLVGIQQIGHVEAAQDLLAHPAGQRCCLFAVGGQVLEHDHKLIAPKPRGENLGLEKFLDKRGGLHHIAFAVENIQSALDELAERGVPLLDRHPRPGARGHHVAFLHPKALGGVLVELVSG